MPSGQAVSPPRSTRGTSHAGDRRLSPATGLWLAAPLLFALAAAVRLINLDQAPEFDELYTLLAARGVLTDGIPRIADGVYDRAELYTRLVAWCFALFGEGFVVARLPSVLAGSLLVVAVFAWTRAVAGDLAAWIAALFLCFSALSVEMSQFARFYALFALAFWLGAIGVYALVATTWRPPQPAALAVAAASALAFAVALYLQPHLAAMGGLGLGLWLTLALALPWFWSRPLSPGWRWGIVAALAALLLAAAVAALQVEPLAELAERYFYSPLHTAEHQNEVWFYHLLLIERYPTLWPLLPFFVLAALAAKPRPALFCACAFGAAFLLLSLAGHKSWRFIFFATPFLYVIWGVALAGAARALGRWAVGVTDRALAAVAPGLPRRPARWARWALIAAGLAFLAVSSGASARTLLLPLGIRLNEGAYADWAGAAALLGPWAEGASVVLTTDELRALYHLGRYDVAVSKERLYEIENTPTEGPFEVDGATGFALDPRTGRPVVGTAAELERILECFPDGLLLADTVKGWRAPTVLDGAMADVVDARAVPIELPAGLRIRAFRWDHPPVRGAPAAAACGAVRALVAGRSPPDGGAP